MDARDVDRLESLRSRDQTDTSGEDGDGFTFALAAERLETTRNELLEPAASSTPVEGAAPVALPPMDPEARKERGAFPLLSDGGRVYFPASKLSSSSSASSPLSSSLSSTSSDDQEQEQEQDRQETSLASTPKTSIGGDGGGDTSEGTKASPTPSSGSLGGRQKNTPRTPDASLSGDRQEEKKVAPRTPSSGSKVAATTPISSSSSKDQNKKKNSTQSSSSRHHKKLGPRSGAAQPPPPPPQPPPPPPLQEQQLKGLAAPAASVGHQRDVALVGDADAGSPSAAAEGRASDKSSRNEQSQPRAPVDGRLVMVVASSAGGGDVDVGGTEDGGGSGGEGEGKDRGGPMAKAKIFVERGSKQILQGEWGNARRGRYISVVEHTYCTGAWCHAGWSPKDDMGANKLLDTRRPLR